jgi:hypothetical protein
MRFSLSVMLLACGALIGLAGCETRLDADINDPNRANTVVTNDPGVVVDVDDNVPARRRDVDADINITGPRGNGVRIDFDSDNPNTVGDDDVNVRVDADRPLLDRRDDDVRIRETRRGVKVDVRD